MKNNLLTLSTAVVMILLSIGSANAAELNFWGAGYIGDARAIAIAPNGEIWVGSDGRIVVFGNDGVFKRVETRGTGGQVNSITFDRTGEPVIGYNGGGFDWYRGAEPRKTGGFNGYSPWEVALDEQQNVYAADTTDGVIKKFKSVGELILLVQTIKAPATDALDHPYSLALDAQNRLYVTDRDKPGLWLFNADGSFARRLLPDQKCWRVRRGPGGMLYVVTDANVSVLDPATGAVTRKIAAPGGYGEVMGFAVDAAGTLYEGNQAGGLVRKYSAEGKLLQTMGPDYQATLTVPDAWTSGKDVVLPLKVHSIASKPAGKAVPALSLALQPANLPGEADSNFYNAEKGKLDPAWWERRQQQYSAQERALTAQQTAQAVQASVPATVATNLYRLVVRADTGAAGDDGGATRQLVQPVSVVGPDSQSSLTLYVPQLRSVFEQGEQIELNVILRSRQSLPVPPLFALAGGTLRFSLVPRTGDSLKFPAAAPLWKQFPVAGKLGSRTLTFHVAAGGIHAGRYLLQAQYSSGTSSNPTATLSDVWPLQIVDGVQATRFHILFPEWSAGYTHIWGPFSGQGMRADSAAVAHEGIELYDTTILGRGQDANVAPYGPEADAAPALMAQAALSPALPAPEKFMAASPLQIELQEALRNGMQVQRDIWGSHFLENWGYANPPGVDRDNRIVKLWTQWQREWPSWIGHRYLTLSIDEGDNPERLALKEQLKTKGLVPPTGPDLDWVRNGYQRAFISDADVPITRGIYGIGADKAGNVYMAASGHLLRYDPQGKLVSKTPVGGGEMMDMAVAPDGTVYGAHDANITKTTPDGKSVTWPATGFGPYSPRGICLAHDGTLLVSDGGNSRIRRFTTDGKFLNDIGDKSSLKHPEGLTTTSDGTIYVADSGLGGLAVFQPDGTPSKFLANTTDSIFGGKPDVCAAPDDTLWVTRGWGQVIHYDRAGKQLGAAGRSTFAAGGTNLPTAVAMTPTGNLLVGCVPLPYAQELTPQGDPVRLIGLNKLLADVRVDRGRYLWADRIIATVFFPVQGQAGDPKATMHAWAQPKPAAGKPAATEWQPLKVQPFGANDFAIATPHLSGDVTLRLAWGENVPLPSAGERLAEGAPQPADFAIQVAESEPATDVQRAADILRRQQDWVHAWAHTRMGALVRWTHLSDSVARSGGHAATQDTAPTNYGTIDYLAEGVYIPYQYDAVVAVTENEGHDVGSFPLMGPFYMARGLEGLNPKPVWSSLLQWYWDKREGSPPSARPLRDMVTLLGAGASGMGVGKLVTGMDETQLALHRKIVDRLHRVGDATMNLEMPGKGGVAILHSFTEEAMDPYGFEQFYTAHAAFYDLLRSHIPTGLVSEELIAGDGLLGRYKAVLLPDIEFALPADTLAGLQRFQQAGGQVWVDLGTRIKVPGALQLKTRYRPFWGQDTYYQFQGGVGVGGYDGNWEYWRMRQGSNARLPALREAFAKLAVAPAASDDPDVYVQERQGGDATYVFAGNDHFPDKPLYKTWLAYDSPAPATVPFRFQVPPGGAIYDALAGKKIDSTPATVAFTYDEPARIWAVLPHPIGGVGLHAAFQDGQLFVTANVQDAGGQTMPAVVPLELTITDAAGRQEHQLWRSTGRDGICRVKVPVGWMAPAGQWKVTARELLSGKSASSAAAVGAQTATTLVADAAPALVFDAPRIARWLAEMKGKEVWIALGKDQAGLRGEATKLSDALTALGIAPKVIDIASIPEGPLTIEYTMTPEQQTALQRVRDGQAIGVRQRSDTMRTPGPTRVIMRPLILLGDPAQNPWLADIHNLHLTRRNLSPTYPGPARALVQFVWAPFYDGFDAVTISATDVAGVRAGIEALVGTKGEPAQ